VLVDVKHSFDDGISVAVKDLSETVSNGYYLAIDSSLTGIKELVYLTGTDGYLMECDGFLCNLIDQQNLKLGYYENYDRDDRYIQCIGYGHCSLLDVKNAYYNYAENGDLIAYGNDVQLAVGDIISRVIYSNKPSNIEEMDINNVIKKSGTELTDINSFKNIIINDVSGELYPIGYIKYKLIYPEIFNAFTISIGNEENDDYLAPAEFTIEGSEEGTTWNVLFEQTDVTWKINESKAFKFINDKPYKYYRLVVKKNYAQSIKYGSYNSLREYRINEFLLGKQRNMLIQDDEGNSYIDLSIIGDYYAINTLTSSSLKEFVKYEVGTNKVILSDLSLGYYKYNSLRYDYSDTLETYIKCINLGECDVEEVISKDSCINTNIGEIIRDRVDNDSDESSTITYNSESNEWECTKSSEYSCWVDFKLSDNRKKIYNSVKLSIKPLSFSYAPREFKIYGYNYDGTKLINKNELYSIKNISWDYLNTQSFTFENEYGYQIYRFEIIQGENDAGVYKLSELKIHSNDVLCLDPNNDEGIVLGLGRSYFANSGIFEIKSGKYIKLSRINETVVPSSKETDIPLYTVTDKALRIYSLDRIKEECQNNSDSSVCRIEKSYYKFKYDENEKNTNYDYYERIDIHNTKE